jgi:uncharacterized membrane protein YagU involved in acid resistance
MNWRGAGLWGFVATVVMTTLLSGSQGVRITRMNIPFILGSFFTPDRDRARLYGFVVHLLDGWVFAALYALAFQSWKRATWWLGAGIGVIHSLFILVAVLPLLPGLHPRMASEQFGPTATKQIEPPGFLGLNYGRPTPISVIVAHIIYGAILGAFYKPK